MNPFKTLLFIALTLGFTACSDKDKPRGVGDGVTSNTTVNTTVPTSTNTTTPTQTPTPTTIDPNTPSTYKSLTLSAEQTTLNKDDNTSLKLLATSTDGTSKELNTDIEYIITPKESAEVNNNTLTAKQDGTLTLQAKVGNTLSNPLSLTVTWTVNGYTLPPEPDKALNEATLLGIDVNHNNVRDDVERKVYVTYEKAIERAVMMQAFRTEQEMLTDPNLIKNARMWAKKEDKAIGCNMYLFLYKNQRQMKKIFDFVNEWQFNTEQRVENFFQYDQALSGGVYSIKEGVLQDCEFDVEKVLEMDR